MTTNLDDKIYNQTILKQKLTLRQNAYMNYLLPSIISFIIYTLLLASEVAVIFRHYCDGNVIWASLTISFIFLPSLGCYVFTISDWSLWPHNEGWTRDNIKWFFLKTFQHLLFPIWAVWRYAERIFWSIEAVRHSDDPDRIKEALSFVSAPRNVELYLFLASFLQSLPQMLFQLALLIRSTEDTKKYTIDAQILSCVFNLTKLSATIAYYHRFKSQKSTGRQYPWLKEYKKFYYKEKKDNFDDDVYAIEPEVNAELMSEENMEKSSSSGSSYLEPVVPSPKTLKKLSSIVVDDTNKRDVNKESIDEPDFNIKRLLKVMGLPDDDVIGKLIAFLWWFTFLLARVFAISAMAYFYLKPTIYLLCAHFIIVEAYLLYDVKTDDLKHSKILFFIFIGFVYIFCIIEFKIRFKKASFIYYGFFMLVYAENFAMCIVWMTKNVQDLENDFWFRYMFYMIVMCFILGISSMIFYFNINKPKKIVVEEKAVNIK